MRSKSLSGISTRFQALSQSVRQVTHVLLTRPPLTSREQAPSSPLDLHVLGTPPAFVLSQDQTLNKSLYLMARIVLHLYTRLVFKDQSCVAISVQHSTCHSQMRQVVIFISFHHRISRGDKDLSYHDRNKLHHQSIRTRTNPNKHVHSPSLCFTHYVYTITRFHVSD